MLLDRDPSVRVTVIERNPEVLEAAQKHFPIVAGEFRLSIVHDRPVSALATHTGPYVAVILDSAGLVPHDPLPLHDVRGLHVLRARLADDGVVFLGGIDRNKAMGVPLDSFLAEAERVFPSTAVLVTDGSIRTPPGSKAAESELALILSTDPYAHFPSTSGGLRLETIHRAQRPRAAELGRVE
jgi:spermidine synthase